MTAHRPGNVVIVGTVDQVRHGAAIDGIDVRTGVTATTVTDRAVRLDDGDSVPYDTLLLATGSRARRLHLPVLGGTYRSEHWNGAVDRNLLGEDWLDQPHAVVR